MENKILRKLVAFMLLIAMNINMFGTNLMLDPNSQHNTKLDTSAMGRQSLIYLLRTIGV